MSSTIKQTEHNVVVKHITNENSVSLPPSCNARWDRKEKQRNKKKQFGINFLLLHVHVMRGDIEERGIQLDNCRHKGGQGWNERIHAMKRERILLAITYEGWRWDCMPSMPGRWPIILCTNRHSVNTEPKPKRDPNTKKTHSRNYPWSPYSSP